MNALHTQTLSNAPNPPQHIITLKKKDRPTQPTPTPYKWIPALLFKRFTSPSQNIVNTSPPVAHLHNRPSVRINRNNRDIHFVSLRSIPLCDSMHCLVSRFTEIRCSCPRQPESPPVLELTTVPIFPISDSFRLHRRTLRIDEC